MISNPLLTKLGFAPGDKVVIVHADDVGLCHASVAAYSELVRGGALHSASTMVPCPWFPAVAETVRTKATDLGVHLTLTSEWSSYRWGPISTRSPASGLVDSEGYLPRTIQELVAKAKISAVDRELEQQFERALEAGIDVSHVDAHMWSLLAPPFWWSYIAFALRHSIPAVLPRYDEAKLRAMGFSEKLSRFASAQIGLLEAAGFPLVDRYVQVPLEVEPEADRASLLGRLVTELEPGLTHLILHPAHDTPELRAFACDWKSRVADFNSLADGTLGRLLSSQGIATLDYRLVRTVFRQTVDSAALLERLLSIKASVSKGVFEHAQLE